MSDQDREIWLACPQPRPAARSGVVCFPCAGSGTVAYRDWAGDLPSEWELCGVQLPGREGRFRDPWPIDLREMAAEVAPLLATFGDRPLSLFGHSCGAFLAFEVAQRLQYEHGVTVERLVVAGAHGAQTGMPLNYRLGDLDEATFRAEVRALGGTAPEVYEQPELWEMLLNIIRQDIRITEAYRPDTSRPLAAPIVALRGIDDWHTNRLSTQRWSELTRGAFHLLEVPGDHFFPYRSRGPLRAALELS